MSGSPSAEATAGWHTAGQYSWDARQIVAKKLPQEQGEQTEKEAPPQPSEQQPERKRRRRFRHSGCQVPGCPNPLQLQYHKVGQCKTAAARE